VFVKVARVSQTVNILIERPERGNSLGVSMASELLEALLELENELSRYQSDLENSACPRILVLRCATFFRRDGRAIWSAGGDLKELVGVISQGDCRDFSQKMIRVCQLLETLPILVIAVLDGLAIGGAAEFALAADVRLVTNAGGFEFRQLDVGLATGFGGGQRLLQLVGKSQAQRLLYLGEEVTGAESVAQRLAHKCFEDLQGLDQYLQQFEARVRRMSRAGIIAQKRILSQVDFSTLKQEMEQFVAIWRNSVHESFLARFVGGE
jgi:enoyl-CoA hydratase/carnithine racemase